MPGTHRREGYLLISESAWRGRIHWEIPTGAKELAGTISPLRPPAQIHSHLQEAAGHPYSLLNQVVPLMHFQGSAIYSHISLSPGDASLLPQKTGANLANTMSPHPHILRGLGLVGASRESYGSPTNTLLKLCNPPAYASWMSTNGPGPSSSRGRSLRKQTGAHLVKSVKDYILSQMNCTKHLKKS